VNEDFTITVPAGARLLDRFRVARFATLIPSDGAAGPVWRYRLSRDTLAHAQRQGLAPLRILAFLQEASGREVPVEAWPEFREIRPGRLKDLPDPERAFREAFYPRSLEERFLGGESYGAFLERILPAYERLLAREWNTLLLVAHGGVIRALLSYALTGNRGFLPLEIHPCGLSVLDIGEKSLLRVHNLLVYDPLPDTRLSSMEELWQAYRS
jgi:hypothetical protein